MYIMCIDVNILEGLGGGASSMTITMSTSTTPSTTPSPESTRESRGIIAYHVIHYNTIFEFIDYIIIKLVILYL